jgi:phosphoribosylformylglycinamidine synthase subunit PurSL
VKEKSSVTLWEIDIHPAKNEADRLANSAIQSAAELGIDPQLKIYAARGFLLQSDLSDESTQRNLTSLLADPITEQTTTAKVGADSLLHCPSLNGQSTASSITLIHVLPKPGVMDPIAQSTLRLLHKIDHHVTAVRTLRKYWVHAANDSVIQSLVKKVLSNDSIEQVVIGPLNIQSLDVSSRYELKKTSVPITQLDSSQLQELSISGQLYLQPAEIQTIREYYRQLGREPSDIELETIAQTWSEHCSHKTLGGRIAYRDEHGRRQFTSMLKETIFAATNTIRKELGKDDWCVSVFKDNAGVVTFDDEHHVVFKVETHNHPSAIEPYGGANTGLGGVIRDPLGTGLGAKPVCSTDVFCFASPDIDSNSLPPGVLHPRRVINGVVAGVRDYGNRMGIPTVNGAVYFDNRYLGNPLVYCGNVGMLPVGKVEKSAVAGDLIVTIGGRTGRDGIHGATFSSVELTEESEDISGGAVQIGNAITEKMVLDILMQARDQGLYNAVTDCGAGGFSSAIGEMGEELGADVHLDHAPLKYDGLTYTEIWISEAQERMILAVPPENWERFQSLCSSEGVESACLGTFTGTGELRLFYHGEEVGSLAMSFLHGGRPPVIRNAVYQPKPVKAIQWSSHDQAACESTLLNILAHPNVASKHWIIRQYDHEVQAGSVVKPLVGPMCDAPSDAAVVQPKLSNQRGIVISCGMNPNFGDYDPYHMAQSVIDEAVRNCVAVGADPSRIAILDNFCWGNTERPETLGELVRASLGCHDLSVAWKTPFISGKDSLNNEFSWLDQQGVKQTISIPCSLLISAIGQIENIRQAITMDLKSADNSIYCLGITREEFGGSLASLTNGHSGGKVPTVDAVQSLKLFNALHQAIKQGLVRSCHDCSEGGLAIAIAEMAFGGNIGAELDLKSYCRSMFIDPWTALFAESNSRFICEVKPERVAAFEATFRDLPCCKIGVTNASNLLAVQHDSQKLINLQLQRMKQVWLAPLDWA